MEANSTVTVLDIGSTKVCCCIANTFADGHFEIIGIGCCVCGGVKAGVIVDMKSVERSIANAVENAENIANFRVKSVYVSISGKGVESRIANVGLNIGGRVVKSEDLMSLFEYCEQETEERAVIHSIPVFYSVDSLHGVMNPIGMIAKNLSVRMNLTTAPKVQLDNLLICLARCHLDPVEIVSAVYASGLCVVDEEDLLSNQIVIDFGGETTSIGFFYRGTFSGMEVIPLGGSNITADIAYGLDTSLANAERLKTLYGSAFASIQDGREVVFAPVIEDDENVINLQQIPKNSLNQIIQARVEEILDLVKKKINASAFTNDFSRSVIITGGGSLLSGIRGFASSVMNKRIKVKKMEDFIDGVDVPINSVFSVAIGMIKFAQLAYGPLGKANSSTKKNKKEGFLKKTLAWIENNL
ncbi:MAG: cell division protein FtsA [Holosporaceae bacterium]|jgi:cell division protein FtsA|nr:cell division protein FtsA [Holosporaceae bacterium]